MNTKVVWCWSLNDPDVLFIFRVGGKEIRVDLRALQSKVRVHNSVFFLMEETALLLQLIQEIKEIK